VFNSEIYSFVLKKLTSRFRLKDSPPAPSKNYQNFVITQNSVRMLKVFSLMHTPNSQLHCPLLFTHIQKMYLAYRYEKDERALPWKLQRCFPPEINVASVITHPPPFIFSPHTPLQKLQTRDVKFKIARGKAGGGGGRKIVTIKECRRVFKRYIRKHLNYAMAVRIFHTFNNKLKYIKMIEC